jgi:hypothetical protein
VPFAETAWVQSLFVFVLLFQLQKIFEERFKLLMWTVNSWCFRGMRMAFCLNLDNFFLELTEDD